MKFCIILSLVICYAISGYTQNAIDYAGIDRKALAIPGAQTNSTANIADYINTHFKTDNEKVRAIYTWVAANIRYNADSIRPIVFEEDRELTIASALRRRKGVCENYASVFNDICLKSRLKSFLIEGYTKQNGSMDKSPHAWCTVFINNTWRLYDPTWDEDRASLGRFTGNISYDYFDVPPAVFIQSHMPFDPMFQLLNYPVTYKEFYNGNTYVNNSKPYFNYADSILVYEKLNPLDKHVSVALRMEKNGTGTTTMVTNKLNKLKMDAEIIYQDHDTTLYNSAIADYNEALKIFNIFINYRNNKFTPVKTDEEVQALFTSIEKQIQTANTKLQEVNRSKATLTLNISALEKVLNDLRTKINEQQAFLKDYFNTVKGS
jgi:hypothetical protein